MKKTEEELDKIHEITMESLYEVFEDEMEIFFKFKHAALDILELGKGTFPFSGPYDCIMDRIDESIDAIEKNISYHIVTQIELIMKERGKESALINPDSEVLKIKFSEKIRQEIVNKGLL